MGRPQKDPRLKKFKYVYERNGVFRLKAPGADGKRKEVILGRTFAEMQFNYHRLIGKYQDANMTLMSEIFEKYLNEELLPKLHATNLDKEEKNISREIRRLEMLSKWLGTCPIRLFNSKVVNQFVYKRKVHDGVKAGQNKDIALLKKVLVEAVHWGVFDSEQVSFEFVKRFKAGVRNVTPTLDEMSALKKHCPRWLQLFIDLKYATALRGTDMLELNSNVWDTMQGLAVETSKTGKLLVFDPTDQMKTIVDELQFLNGHYRESKRSHVKHSLDVWWFFAPERCLAKDRPLKYNGLNSAWQRAMNDAIKANDLTERFQIRDLRKSSACACQTLFDAQKMLGHTDPKVTERIYRRGAVTQITPLSI